MTITRIQTKPLPVRFPVHAVDGDMWPRLSLTLTSRGGQCVLAVSGDLDATSAVAVETAYEQLLRAGFDEVVLDVTELRHIDESGAVAFARLWAELRNNGVFCRVRGLHPVFADNPLELLLLIRTSGSFALSGLLRAVPGADGPVDPRDPVATRDRDGQPARPDEAATSRNQVDRASVRSMTVRPVVTRTPPESGARGAGPVTSR